MIKLYASSDGTGDGLSAGNPGSLSAVKTLVKTYHGADNVLVLLRGGRYDLSNGPLIFDATDSPAEGYKVLWEAYPEEKPILSGGVPITGWTLHDAGKNIWRASVPAGLKARQFWVDGNKSERTRWFNPESTFGNLSVSRIDTSPLVVESFDCASFPALVKAPADMELHRHNGVYGGGAPWRHSIMGMSDVTRSGDVTTFTFGQNYSDFWEWAHDPVSGDDLTNFVLWQTIYSWAENAYEFLNATTKGCHFLPSTEDFIYYVPRDGEDMASVECFLPKTENLIKSDAEMKDIEFVGVSMQHTTWMAPTTNKMHMEHQCSVYADPANGFKEWSDPTAGYAPVPNAAVILKGAANINFHQCEVSHIGGEAVRFDLGCTECSFNGASIEDVSAAGVSVGSKYFKDADDGTSSYTGYYSAVRTDGCMVRSVKFRNVVNEYSDGAAIDSGFGQNLKFLHNDIYDVPYIGITHGWGWATMSEYAWLEEGYGLQQRDYSHSSEIAYNRIVKTCMELRDGGSIYTLGEQLGLKIHHNFLSECGNREEPDGYVGSYGYNTIYADEGARYQEYYNNIILYNALRENHEAININRGASDGELYYHDNFAEEGMNINTYLDGPYYWPGHATVNPASEQPTGIDTDSSLWPQDAKDIYESIGLELCLKSAIVEGRGVIYGWKENADDTVVIDEGAYTIESYEEPTDLMWRAVLTGVNDDYTQLSVNTIVAASSIILTALDGSPLTITGIHGNPLTLTPLGQ